MKLSKNKVVLGLSGGVDSAAAALLLKEQGFEVVGFYFDVTGDNEDGKKAAQDLARRMNIEFYAADVSEVFAETVISDFCSEYAQGRTPNPCIVCNPAIKFKSLTDLADRLGAYHIATGHYARIAFDEERNLYFVRRGANEKKDQSYMLYRLSQDVLSRLIFPLGEFQDKGEIRALAEAAGLPNAKTADSQEICFIDESKEHYTDFLARHGVAAVPGHFTDNCGNLLGIHHGCCRYTVGQRKGLGVALGKPVFVTEIDSANNKVILGDHKDLFKSEIHTVNHFFTATSGKTWPDSEKTELAITAKIRYAAPLCEARISPQEGGRLLVRFEKPQRAPAPGQSVVFYDGDLVIGGGFIR